MTPADAVGAHAVRHHGRCDRTGIDRPTAGSAGGLRQLPVTFPASVTSITIRYEPALSNYQYVGVRDLSFTVPGP
ncbi:MAG: hypothetical protein R2726_01465 [Acidimicrobiales bacterium]